MSRTQTKFIEATSVELLTEKVQEAERDGWSYAGMGMSAAQLDPGSTIDMLMGPRIHLVLVAAVQRLDPHVSEREVIEDLLLR